MDGHLDIVKLLVASGIDYKASYAIGGIDKCDASFDGEGCIPSKEALSRILEKRLSIIMHVF